MIQASKKLVVGDEVRFGKHRLDQMPSRMARNLVMFRPSEAILQSLLEKARLEIPGLAETEEVLKTFRYNPEFVMALTRKSRFDPQAPIGEGFIAMLPLNMLGLQHLALGTFDASSPDTRLLAKPHGRPAGVYLWGVYAPGPLVAGMALFMEKMTTEQYAGVDIYSRPNTDAGRHFNHAMGFVQGTRITDIEAPNVWKFSRTAEQPPYDSYVPGTQKKDIGITVARTFDDLMKVIAVRNAVYVGEQECPYDEEYDGNDLSAVHLLAYIGDEPVGCLRLRFFADFAKFERVAIRKEFRKSRAAIKLVQAGLKFCQKKGYRRVIGHAQTRLASFWTRFGFRPMEGREHFIFSDYEYVEMVAELELDPNAVTLGADPYLMIRPEGRWHVTGVLEQSAARAATQPSVKKNH
jgi:predicted GNAT family N-acyltransferase